MSIVTLLLKKETLNTMRRAYISSEASKHGQLDFVCMALNNGTLTIPHLDTALRLSLYEAANRGYYEVVRLLLAHGALSIYLWDEFRVASGGGYERVVRLILEHAEETRTWPNTLVPAASKGQAHVVTLSLESRAHLKLERCDEYARHALKAAMIEGYESVVRKLSHHGVSIEIGSDRSNLQ